MRHAPSQAGWRRQQTPRLGARPSQASDDSSQPPADPPCTLRSHGEAALALHIHEVRVGGGYQALQLVLPLLQLRRGVQQVDVARQHLRAGHSNVLSMHKRGSGPARPQARSFCGTPSSSVAPAGGGQPPSARCWTFWATGATTRRAPGPPGPRGGIPIAGAARMAPAGRCWPLSGTARAWCRRQRVSPPTAAASCAPGGAAAPHLTILLMCYPLLPAAARKESEPGCGPPFARACRLPTMLCPSEAVNRPVCCLQSQFSMNMLFSYTRDHLSKLLRLQPRCPASPASTLHDDEHRGLCIGASAPALGLGPVCRRRRRPCCAQS